MFILVLLLRLTYCQSSQVTGMLTAVKKQFVSTKLQLKYYQAAILDWQDSEGLLNSQQLPLAEAEVWRAAKYDTFAEAGHPVNWHPQPSVSHRTHAESNKSGPIFERWTYNSHQVNKIFSCSGRALCEEMCRCVHASYRECFQVQIDSAKNGLQLRGLKPITYHRSWHVTAV